MWQLSLENKVALVTGASRGLGQATLALLGKMGATVVGTATTEKSCEQISKFCEAEGIKGFGKVLNVDDSDSIANCIKEITDSVGAPLILVNNAGITRDNLLMRMKDEEWQATLDTNLTGVFRLTKACLRPMIKAKWGRVICLSSVVGLTGNPGQANYAATKAGVIGFVKSLAQEVGSRGITVNVVAPGFIDSDMTRALPEQQREQLQKAIPMGKIGDPADIAAAVGFLASDAASYITGETININGGMSMN